MRRPRIYTALCVLLGCISTASAQDALRGKRFYLDTAGLTGASVNCVDCHRGLPPGLFGIGRAANNPAIIANALNSVPQMAPLRGRLAAGDIADLAAYIGNPAVPSLSLRVGTRSPAGTEGIDRLDFGAILLSQTSARGTVLLSNDGALPLRLMSSVRIVGPQAGEYSLFANSCAASLMLGPAQSCEIGITFRPEPSGAGLRRGALQVDHDWVGATAAVALLGTAETAASNPPVGGSAGGGAFGNWLWVLIAGLGCRRVWKRPIREP